MTTAFYVCAVVAVVATLMTITRRSAMHALLYLIVSLLAVAVVFFTLGAPFVAALEVIVYAGAIMVLFIFVIMMLNPGMGFDTERLGMGPWAWAGPSVLGAIVVCELFYVVTRPSAAAAGVSVVGPVEVSASLFGPYAIAVELASLLLLAALVGVFHLGRRPETETREEEE